MCGFTRDDKHRTRRNRLNIGERIEVHELDVAAQGRMRSEFRRAAFRRELTSRCAVEVVELPLNWVGVFVQVMTRSAGVFSFTAGELDIPLLCSLCDDLL